MNLSLNYIIEMVLTSAVLGGAYFLFFKNLTFFKLNRFYILLAILLPLVSPLFKMPVSANRVIPNVTVLLDEVSIGAKHTSIVESVSVSFLQWVYVSVVLLLLCRIIIGVLSILSIFRKANKQVVDGRIVYVSSQKVNSFSVFKRMVVSEDIYSDRNSRHRILLHEATHIKQAHGVDLFIAEIVCALFWFNLMAWLLKKELKSTHEYLADEKVLEQDFDLAGYFMLMFDNIVGRNVGLANNFNQSLNLKRMKMMKKKRSPRFMKIASVVAIPFVFGATIMLTSQCTSSEMSESDVAAESGDVSFKSAAVVIEETEGPIFMVVEKMPEFPGGNEALMDYLCANVKYPKAALDADIQGRVYVQFVVSKEGKINNVEILNGVDPVLDAEAMRVVKAMPDWEPGKQRGNFVNVSYRLPINFALR